MAEEFVQACLPRQIAFCKLRFSEGITRRWLVKPLLLRRSKDVMCKKVLICDDEPSILRAAEFKFLRAGYQVITAGDGEEGWQAALEFQPSVIVTDCQMPRLNGLELAARLKNHPATSHIPVLMLTAKGFELPLDEVRERYGVRDVLAKPFSPRALFAAVEALLTPQETASASA